MSKGTRGGLPWSGWPWGRMRAGPDPRATGNRTGKRPAASLVGLLLALSAAIACGGPQRTYDKARAAYQRGQLGDALTDATAGVARWKDPASPWHWNFRLLSAET